MTYSINCTCLTLFTSVLYAGQMEILSVCQALPAPKFYIGEVVTIICVYFNSFLTSICPSSRSSLGPASIKYLFCLCVPFPFPFSFRILPFAGFGSRGQEGEAKKGSLSPLQSIRQDSSLRSFICFLKCVKAVLSPIPCVISLLWTGMTLTPQQTHRRE